jgi:hypothetical protein
VGDLPPQIECVLALPSEGICIMADKKDKKHVKDDQPFETFSTEDDPAGDDTESGGGGPRNPPQPGGKPK